MRENMKNMFQVLWTSKKNHGQDHIGWKIASAMRTHYLQYFVHKWAKCVQSVYHSLLRKSYCRGGLCLCIRRRMNTYSNHTCPGSICNLSIEPSVFVWHLMHQKSTYYYHIVYNNVIIITSAVMNLILLYLGTVMRLPSEWFSWKWLLRILSTTNPWCLVMRFSTYIY
jgi:hypothetical protein